MTQIIKGGNLPLSGEPMRVAVVRRSGGPGALEVDAAALLVEASGKVRDQGDLVFYNQPEHAGSGVRLLGSAQGEGGVTADWLEIDPGRVEASVERVVVSASCEGGVFGQVSDLYMQVVSAVTGEQLALYAVEDATTETAILLGEFYRRSQGWKFRAVGQGYASGLPGLAADFGFSVPAEEPADEATDEPDPEPLPRSLPPAPPLPPEAYLPVAARPTAQDVTVAEPVPAVDAEPVATTDGAVADPAAPYIAGGGAFFPRNALPADFGPEFPYFEQSGKNDGVIHVEVDIPAGFVIVEVVTKGSGYTELITLNHRNRDDKSILYSSIEDLQGRCIADHHGLAPLRMRIRTSNQWTVSVRPVSTLRELNDKIEGHGPDVLAHTGGPTDIAIRHRGDKHGDGVFEIQAMRPNGKLDDVFYKYDRGRGSAPLAEGPRLLPIRASGGWTITPRPVGSGNFWSRRR
ncbi:TerD family protein [Streptomyces sp. NPDC054887]